MVIQSPSQTRYTYNDYLHLPEDNRYEIIDGALYMVPAPLTYHQKVSIKLASILNEHAEERTLGEVYPTPIDVIFTDSDIVQPDIIFISNENMSILKRENVQGAPDLVVEILSPSSRKRDREQKHELYSRFGVKEYWITDPDSQMIDLYTLQNQSLILHNSYQQADTLQSIILPELSFPLTSIFR